MRLQQGTIILAFSITLKLASGTAAAEPRPEVVRLAQAHFQQGAAQPSASAAASPAPLAVAQAAPDLQLYPNQPPPGFYDSSDAVRSLWLEERTGRRMRAAGIALTTIGIVPSAVLIGFGTVIFGLSESEKETRVGASLLAAGVTLFACGLGTGIPLWAVGQHKINKARQSYRGISMLPWAAPMRSPAAPSAGATGATAGMIFRF